MTFPGATETVRVDFYEANLYITDYIKDGVGEKRSWTMQMGFIDEDVAIEEYGIYFKENVLGLAPMTLTTDEGAPTTTNLD